MGAGRSNQKMVWLQVFLHNCSASAPPLYHTLHILVIGTRASSLTLLSMEEEPSDSSGRQRCRQTISVPFLWEEKPGKPKKDWKLEALAIVPVPPPAKLVVSVPFLWEEKPGKPWEYLSQNSADSATIFSPEKQLINYSSSASSPFSFPSSEAEEEATTISDFDADNDDNDGDISESDFEAFTITSNQSFHSARSLLVNQPLATNLVSNAVPVHQLSVNDPLTPLESSNEENDPSNNQLPVVAKTGHTTSLWGEYGDHRNPVLEFLFPLFAPKSGFLDKVWQQDGCSSIILPEASAADGSYASKCGLIGKRAPTLGELIMMSRRLSYGRKVTQFRKQNHSMGFMKKTVFAWIFGAGTRKKTRTLHSRQLEYKQILG